MEIRYKYIFTIIALLSSCVTTEDIKADIDHFKENNSSNCPFSKIVEDIFNIHNKSSANKEYAEDRERAKLFLHTIANVTSLNGSKTQEELVNNIIASINKIKNDINQVNKSETKLNEAIIINPSSDVNEDDSAKLSGPKIVSGVEDKVDIVIEHSPVKKKTNNNKTFTTEQSTSTTTEKVKYMEVLTIEPNNTSVLNTSSHNIIDVLKHLMPLFNNTLTKKLHNITIIESNYEKNHSFTATKNVSTIVVTYCDKENLTKPNFTNNLENDEPPQYDKYEDDEDEDEAMNMTVGEKRDIMEAAEYGMRKMHELYSVLEPKLYSMGLWLDDTNPARYVAAFNAPSEDSAKYSRYGYATLQAATRLRQLTSGDNGGGVESRTEETQFPAASALRQSPLMQHCPLRGAPKCPPASKRYRTHDGTCNNLHRPRWGSTMTPVQRFLPPSYSDDLQAPRRSVTGLRLPSAREISSLVHQSENVENLGITHLLMQWGQFLDHDVTSSSQSRGFNGSVPRCCKDGGRDFIPREFMHPECFPITVPSTDPFYGPRGIRCLDFIRSAPAPRDDCALGWREQMNQVSAFIDGSPLYGSSARQSDKLRLFRNGMLQYGRVQQRRPILPPERKDELCRGGAVSTDCFKSGDARVNEHPGLVAAHIVWLRQHNRMAQELAHLNPHWSDEKIYQETRKIVGAMIQHITYREFLPIVLGPEVMNLFDLELLVKGYYREYNPKINPSPASSFGSAAFRFGHSLVQSSMVRYDSFHRPLANNVSLHNELTNPSNIWSIGAVDRLLLGMVNQPIQHRDEFITEELTNHLFQTPQIDFGMDLAAINIQRGRDHGVPSYTTWREPCGLSAIKDFEDLLRVMPERAVRKLQALYRHVDDIDLFTGGMAERPVMGGLVGPTFACIIAQQFSNLRKGDRFWYENGGFDSSFTPAQLQQIRRISFAQVLCRTLDTIDTVQPFVFLSPNNPDNDRTSCQNGLLNNFDLSAWIEIDSDSNKIRTAEDDTPSTSTENTKRKQTTTTKRPHTSKKPLKGANKDAQIIRSPTKANTTKTSDKHSNKNLTNDTDLTSNKTTITNNTTIKPNKTVHIDDKLDFKNKSRRYDDPDIIDSRQNRPTKYDEYDYDEDDTQSVQSVIINNVHHKRPYKRPVITVTENTNKYTYLINYVPRPTESWRQTTRKTHDRDVVKVTYQTYDDTYRRPNKPYYYNKRDNDENYNTNQHNRHTTDTDIIYYSARSNDATDKSTTKSKADNADTSYSSTTDSNLYKLVTFGYVGSYKGQASDKTIDRLTVKDDIKPKLTDSKFEVADLKLDKTVTKIDKPNDNSGSKDFENDKTKSDVNDDDKNYMKLSTFYLYETATKPYTLPRPTRRNDEESVPNYSKTNVKYYYVRNVLHKYSDNKTVETIKTHSNVQIATKVPGQKPKVPDINIEERSSANRLTAFEDVETKPPNTNRQRVKTKKPASSLKTPSVAFQVIPSENSPSLWAVYEENAELSQILPHKMPLVKSDPHALKEIPRPINLNGWRRRRPGRI